MRLRRSSGMPIMPRDSLKILSKAGRAMTWQPMLSFDLASNASSRSSARR